MAAVNKINDIKVLEGLTPLNELDQDKLQELMDSSTVMQFTKGQSISSATEKNLTVFLLSGSVERAPGAADAELVAAGTQPASKPILAPGNRRRVVARNNVTVLCVDSELLDFLRSWGRGGGVEVDEINADGSGQWIDGLMQSDAVLSLSPASIQALMTAIAPVEFEANEIVFKKGDAPDFYYIISQGHCSIMQPAIGKGEPVEIAMLGPGDSFGEESLIANATRNATVRMIDNGLLLRLEREDFNRLFQQSLLNTIDQKEAQKLTASGAVRLDVRSAYQFARDGEGINIPLEQLRNRINELDKSRRYIVVSDDNRLSAVAAFLLSQKQLRVYLLNVESNGNAVARAAEAEHLAGTMQSAVADLQKRLQETTKKLQAETDENVRSKDRITQLEAELKQTQAGARSVIVEAGSLKSRSEATSRKRISELAEELEKVQQIRHSLAEENGQIKSQLNSLNAQVVRMQELSAAHGGEAGATGSDAQLKQQDVIDLEKQLEALMKNQEQTLAENRSLIEQLEESRQGGEEKHAQLGRLKGRLNASIDRAYKAENDLQASHRELEQIAQQLGSLKDQYAQLERTIDTSNKENEALSRQLAGANQTIGQKQNALEQLQNQLAETETLLENGKRQYAELQAVNDRLLETVHSLEQQLQEAGEELEGKTSEIADLQGQIEQMNKRYEALAEELQATRQQLSEAENSLEVSYQANHQAQQQIKQLNQDCSEQEKTISALNQDIEKQAHWARQEQISLNDKIDTIKNMMVEKKKKFNEAENDYKQQINDLSGDLYRAGNDLAALRDEISREQLRNQVLTEELERLNDENKRSGFMIKFLSIVILLAGIAVGVAYYLGYDIQNQAAALVDEAAPEISRLIDSIPVPEPLKKHK